MDDDSNMSFYYLLHDYAEQETKGYNPHKRVSFDTVTESVRNTLHGAWKDNQQQGTEYKVTL